MEGGFSCTQTRITFHKNIVSGVSSWDDKSGCRPFFDVHSHNQAIVDGINEVVGSEDVLIHLGDWSFGGRDKVKEFRDRVNCERIAICLGNHDIHIRANKELQDLFFWCGDYLEMRYKGYFFVMMHYLFGSWNGAGKSKTICLGGHSHGSYPARGKQLDCGPESIGYNPLSLDEIIERMKNVEVEKVDHHGESTSSHY